MAASNRVDLSATFCGIRFPNPFVLSSAPPTASGEMIRRAFDAGWGGAVIKTLAYAPSAADNWNVTPRIASLRYQDREIGISNFELASPRALDLWMREIGEIKRDYPDRALIASLMHTMKPCDEQWVTLAKMCEDAGADGIELNLSCPHGMAEQGGGGAIGSSPAATEMVTGWVTGAVSIPVIAKIPGLAPDIVAVAKAAAKSGVSGITTINTILGLIGVDIENHCPIPNVGGMGAFTGCSGPIIKPIGLRCVAQVAGSKTLPICGSGGIATWSDAVEYVMLGASIVQVCSAVMMNGYGIIEDLVGGLARYMRRQGFASVADMVGLALPKLGPQRELSRERKVVSSIDQSRCLKDGRCFVACRDAGYQAISLNEEGYPVVDETKCDGCGLCAQICPVWGCVAMKNTSAPVER